MLKIQVVIGTNRKQKIGAVSCITGGQRIQWLLPLISQLLLFLYLHKEKLHTSHKEEPALYLQRRRGNNKNHKYHGRRQRMPVVCQNIAIDQTAGDDHPCIICCEQGSRATPHKWGLHSPLNKKLPHSRKHQKKGGKNAPWYQWFLTYWVFLYQRWITGNSAIPQNDNPGQGNGQECYRGTCLRGFLQQTLKSEISLWIHWRHE